ncbi:hypothetical protein GDO81_004493 [Engystomops pustulosus]|uniref:Interferon-induced protein with tetratricopeptide repeats 5 n=1 Tax=Engystomops pustulosus TaxID=76066 RepID=A0AAV6ZY05_ENGPU|nr:hypothetical protein GDO81_004493 [Engystomops pustulosus]
MKLRLLQLKCHFTWKLLVQDTDPEELEERLFSQLTFLVTKNKYMVHNLLAYVMHLRGDHTKAIDHLKKAEEMIEEKNPEENSKKYLVTYGNYAWVFYYLNQTSAVSYVIDKAEIAEIYGEKAWSLLKFCGQYYEDAKQSFEKALELEPEDPEWITGYATVVYRLEGFNKKPSPASTCKSLDLLKRAVEMNPTDAVVKFYRRAGMIDDALSVLKTAVDVNPNSGFQHHQIGLCYRLKYFIQKKKFGNKRGEGLEKEMNDLIQNAIFHFEKTLEFKKTFVYAHVDLANMYSEAKEYQKAEDTFKTVLAFPSLKDEEKQQVYYNYGQFKEFCMRSEPEAIDYYKNCLQIKKSQKEREFAEKSVKRISAKKIRNSIHDAEGYALLGFLYKSNGDRNDAVDCYAKALEYDPYNEEYVSELCELKLMI